MTEVKLKKKLGIKDHHSIHNSHNEYADSRFVFPTIDIKCKEDDIGNEAQATN